MKNKVQQGYVLFAMLLVVFVSGSSIMISAFNNHQSTINKKQVTLVEQMALAKQALLAYAASTAFSFNEIGPGHLPCPDLDVTDNLGTPETDCDPATENLGRLPQFVTLGNGNRFNFNEYYAYVDQQFWYAVSPDYIQSSNQSEVMNSSKTGVLNLDNLNDVVAVIIAPGEELDTQNRPANLNDYANYLDSGNGVNTSYVTSFPANPDNFNDKIIAITKSELLDSMTLAAAIAIKSQLDYIYDFNPWFANDYPLAIFGYTPQGLYELLMNVWASVPGPNWTRAESLGGQDWVDISTYTYDLVSKTASLRFDGCATVFSFTRNSNVSKSQNSCI